MSLFWVSSLPAPSGPPMHAGVLSEPLPAGGIPGPIAFGWLIDKACLLWQDQCGQPGSCFVYQNSAMSRYMFVAGLVYKVREAGPAGGRESRHLLQGSGVSPGGLPATRTPPP